MIAVFIPQRVRADETETVTKSTIKLYQMDTKKLSLKGADSDAVVWYSSNPNICVVTKGLVQGIGAGKCTVTATYQNKKYQWPVNVLALKLNKTSITLLKRREGFQLKLNSKNASKYAEWRTSNSSIASVSANGYVTPHSSGRAVMNARYGNVTVSCSVSVMDVTIATLRKVNSPKSNKQKIILADGGILDHWTNAYSAFGSTDVINNSISNSSVANWISWCKKLITSYKPKVVVLCLGTSDIGNGIIINPDGAEQTSDAGRTTAVNVQKLIEKIHRKSKKTKVLFCSLPCFPQYETAWDAINIYNGLMKTYCGRKKYVTYLELNSALMKNGKPNASLFKTGHRYLSASGYDVMKRVVVKKVKKVAKKK